MDTQYLTKEKFDELKTELDFLRNTRRKEVVEHLEYAKKLGDLSENAEYHEAREEQAGVEDRIAHLESLIKTAKVVEGKKTDAVTIGSKVTVQKEGESEKRVYTVVSSEEADMSIGKMSNISPLGAALFGKRKGDIVSIETPKGKSAYTIVSIE